jgi:hypothetical protein
MASSPPVGKRPNLWETVEAGTQGTRDQGNEEALVPFKYL